MNTLLHWLTSPEWELIVKALLHSLWQGALIAGALALLLRRVASPEARYRIAVAGLGAVLLSAIITWGVLNVPKQSAVPVTPMPETNIAEKPVATSPVEKIVVAANWTPARQQTQWTARLALVWLLGASAMLGRASVKVAGAEQLRRSCQPLDDPRIAELVADARRAVKLTRQVRVAVTSQLTSPAVVGVLVPTLILPLSLVTTLSPEQIRFILLHELAHIRRGDYLANLFQLFAEALLFFNPAVWWLSHQIRREREACCDALAIELSGAPADYARTLVSVAETMLNPSPAAAPAFGNDREPSSLADRVQRVLVPGYRPSLRLTWRAMLAALAVGGLLLGLLAVGTRETVAATAALLEPKSASTNSPAESSVANPTTAINPAAGLPEGGGTNLFGEPILIHADGGYEWAGKNLDLSQIRVRIASIIAVDESLPYTKGRESQRDVKPVLHIKADAKAPFKAVSSLMDTLKEIGVSVSADLPPAMAPDVKAMQATNLYSRTFKVGSNALAQAIEKYLPPGEKLGSTNNFSASPNPIRQLFASLGVDLQSPGKSIFYKDRQGIIIVRATLQDLDAIEAWAQTLSPGEATSTGSSLFTRTFKVNTNELHKGLDTIEDSAVTNLSVALRGFFASIGIDLQPPKAMYFNERQGALLIRASQTDLDVIEQAIWILNQPAPQVNIRAKFVEVPEKQASALLASATTTTNLDGQITGILTEPQAKALFKSLEQAKGVDILSAPEVTTVSGRQAQIQIAEIRTVVTGLSTVTATNGVNTNLFQTSPLPFGPTLDVIPYVSADGYTVQMVLIPSITEFLGYDSPDSSLKKFAKEKGVSPEVPLPRYRVRQLTTTAIVWDGQTLMLGGLKSEFVTRQPDGTETRKPDPKAKIKLLFVFITPTIIDPAGNRVHTDEEMPSRTNSVPKQPGK